DPIEATLSWRVVAAADGNGYHLCGFADRKLAARGYLRQEGATLEEMQASHDDREARFGEGQEDLGFIIGSLDGSYGLEMDFSVGCQDPNRPSGAPPIPLRDCTVPEVQCGVHEGGMFGFPGQGGETKVNLILDRYTCTPSGDGHPIHTGGAAAVS